MGAMQLDEAEQSAHCQAVYWAELLWNSFASQEAEPPLEWPGSIEQARFLVGISTSPGIETSDRELLTDMVQARARKVWREFRSIAGPARSSNRLGSAQPSRSRLTNPTC